ncbi:MAG: CRISPR-associated endoribonuclease Cas6 [Chloroflexia bacterium]|nr:CRISPR-associated endoribonuclease Cas6 [Bacteroidales bacterium]NJO89571.1 CRISPR-associated endoribonuclease Cas6 [Chloroflexia bacterium]
MRIHLKLTAKDLIIPFDHQHLVVGTIHKWLGWNDLHGDLSLYSFSRLEGGKSTTKGLKFDRFASFFFSAYDASLIKQLISGIRIDPILFDGLSVEEIIIEEDPDLSEREQFYVASPIFIKRRSENKVEHILFSDERSAQYLKETLQTKMQKVGIMDESLEVKFDLSYSHADTKMVTYKGVKNKTNWCSVIVKAMPETKLFAWNVGLGNSTGIGFGAIK